MRFKMRYNTHRTIRSGLLTIPESVRFVLLELATDSDVGFLRRLSFAFIYARITPFISK